MISPEKQSAATDSSVDPEVAAILRSLAPEEVDMLRDAFIYMDRDSDGYVSREEMMAKVSACVGTPRFGPLREYLVPLFNVADKDGDGRLSLTEFLTSFADGPGVVPAEVVNNCVAGVRVRLTDEEISALQENFRAIDRNQDGVVDAEELEAALRDYLLKKFPDLTGENFKEIVAVVMASADTDRDGVLSLSEFIRSYQEDQGVLPATFLEVSFDRRSGARQLSEEETTVLREAFAVLDRNDDGFVDVDDLYSALWDTLGSGLEDQDQIRDLCDLIMMTAGRSKRGRLTVSDFIRGFLSNMHLMQIPVAVAQERVRVACDKLQQMHNSGELEKLVLVFEDLDRDGDGYVARSEMVSVLKALFRDAFPGWDDEMLTSVMTAIVVGAETNNGGQLSLEEFIRSFVEGPGAPPPVPAESWNASSNTRLANTLATASSSTPAAPAAPAAPLRERRVSTATDEDLLRITEAVKELYAQEGRGGAISHEALHTSIAHVYTDNPAHGEEMYHYALQQFVRPCGDGMLEWSENVHIEDEEEEEEEADARDSVDPQNSSYGVPRASISTSAPLEAPSTANGSASVVSAVAELMRRSGSEVDFAQDGMKTLPASLPRAEDARGSSANKVALPPLKPPPAQLESITNNAYFNDDLRKEFDRYDVDHRGYLDREAFKKAYLQMEHFGLEPSPAELDLRFRRYAHGSDKLYFNEFCILMLQRARM